MSFTMFGKHFNSSFMSVVWMYYDVTIPLVLGLYSASSSLFYKNTQWAAVYICRDFPGWRSGSGNPNEGPKAEFPAGCHVPTSVQGQIGIYSIKTKIRARGCWDLVTNTILVIYWLTLSLIICKNISHSTVFRLEYNKVWSYLIVKNSTTLHFYDSVYVYWTEL